MNKIIKKIVAGLSIGMILFGTGCSKEVKSDKLSEIIKAGKIVLGTSPDYAPNEFYILDENGKKKIVGSDIALAQAIADKIGVKLEIKATDFSGVLANIQSKEVDLGISGLSFTEERAKAMQFSKGYHKESSVGYQGLLLKKENVEKYKSIEDLKAKKLKIGAQNGSIQYELAMKLTDGNNVKQMGTLDQLSLALNQGDIDAVVISSDNTRQIVSTFPNLVMLPKETFNLDPEDKYATDAVAFPQGDEYKSLVELVNQVIDENTANGNITKWREEAVKASEKAVQ